MPEHLVFVVWTADERFWNAATTAFPRMRWIGEVMAPSEFSAKI